MGLRFFNIRVRMVLTLRTMRRLLCLIPWMGLLVSAVQGQSPPSEARIHYTHRGELTTPAFRIGEECYVALARINELNWSAVVAGSRVTVTAGPHKVTVAPKFHQGQTLIPLGAVLKELGGGTGWAQDDRTFEVWSEVIEIGVVDGSIRIKTSLDVRPSWLRLEGPAGLALDLSGARLTSRSKIGTSGSALVRQATPQTVRILFDKSSPTQPLKALPDLLREWEVPIVPAKGPEPARTPPETRSTGAKEPIQAPPSASLATAPEPSLGGSPAGVEWEPWDKQPPKWSGPLSPQAGPVRMTSDGPQSGSMLLKLSGPLPDAARFTRPEPSVLEIVLPRTRWSADALAGFRSASIKGAVIENRGNEAVLRLTLVRPMGLQLAHEPDGIHLTLIKPNVGDGKLAGKVVVVDAGHGGHDTGARSPDKKLNEKDLALAIANLTAKRLSEQGATVVLTRKGDQFIALKERSEIANRNGAHFFLSVHINSNQVANSSTGGITFYHQQDPVGMLLADCIQGEIAKVSGLPNLGTWSDRRIYETGFAVLRYAKMPAVLIEMGFINNSKDRARMSTADFKEKVAGAIVQGLRAYLGDGKQED